MYSTRIPEMKSSTTKALTGTGTSSSAVAASSGTASKLLASSVTAPFRVRGRFGGWSSAAAAAASSVLVLDQLLMRARALATSTITYLPTKHDCNHQHCHHNHHNHHHRHYHSSSSSSSSSSSTSPHTSRHQHHNHQQQQQHRITSTSTQAIRQSIRNPYLLYLSLPRLIFWSRQQTFSTTAATGNSSSSSSSSSSSPNDPTGSGGKGSSSGGSGGIHFLRRKDKVESYFSAIGFNQTDDQPPPNLTSEQVTEILRTNESLIFSLQTFNERERFIQNFSDVIKRQASTLNNNNSNNNSNSNNRLNHQQQRNKSQTNKITGANRSNRNQSKSSSTTAAASTTSSPHYQLINNQWVTSIESNQLASNHPIEDRLRVSTLHLNTVLKCVDDNVDQQQSTTNDSQSTRDEVLCFGVIDGHGGGLCADVITRRLFLYITVALRVAELQQQQLLQHGDKSKKDHLQTLAESLRYDSTILQTLVTDHTRAPQTLYHNIHTMYEDSIAERLQTRIEEFEWRALEQFAREELQRAHEELKMTRSKEEEEERSKSMDEVDLVERALCRAFNACDRDLSHEIQVNLLNTNASNVLLHYYLSLAVSGACANIVILYRDDCYVANTGDCRAVLGTLKRYIIEQPADDDEHHDDGGVEHQFNGMDSSSSFSQSTTTTPKKRITRKVLKSFELSAEHNSDNIGELNRLMAEHPKEEHNHLIRDHRLLGTLMPTRAFGDFTFKWPLELIMKLGLPRAFGSHIIPQHYHTPPYLTAEPEITKLCLKSVVAEQQQQQQTTATTEDPPSELLDRFIILATDGLWEQFDTARKVVKAVNRYRQSVRAQIKAFTSAHLYRIEPLPNSYADAEQHQLSSSSESSSPSSSLTLGAIVDRLRAQITEPPAQTFERITADDDLIEDLNCGTFLLRTALSDVSSMVSTPMAQPQYTSMSGFAGSGSSKSGSSSTTSSTKSMMANDEEDEEDRFSHHVDQYEQQRARHAKLVTSLTLPHQTRRNFRDDISLIVIGLN